MLNEQLKWRVFPTVFKYSRRHMKSWLKPRLQESQVDTHLKMIHACTNLQILNYEVIFLRSSADYARRIRRWNPRRRTIWKIKFARSSQRTVTRAHTHPSNRGVPRVGRPHRVWVAWRAATRDLRPSRGHHAGGRKSVSKALSTDFGDNHAMDNLRTRIASRKEKNKQVAEGASKSQSSQGGSSKDAKKATIGNEGRKLTRLIDRALHDISGVTEAMDEAKAADCTVLRPLALKLAEVYKPWALVVKKTELIEGVYPIPTGMA